MPENSISKRETRIVMKKKMNREISPRAIEKFSEIGTLILEEFAAYVEDVASEDGEKTRVRPRHIEAAHSRFMRDKNADE